MDKNTKLVAAAVAVIVAAIIFGPIVTDWLTDPTTFESNMERTNRLIEEATGNLNRHLDTLEGRN